MQKSIQCKGKLEKIKKQFQIQHNRLETEIRALQNEREQLDVIYGSDFQDGDAILDCPANKMTLKQKRKLIRSSNPSQFKTPEEFLCYQSLLQEVKEAEQASYRNWDDMRQQNYVRQKKENKQKWYKLKNLQFRLQSEFVKKYEKLKEQLEWQIFKQNQKYVESRVRFDWLDNNDPNVVETNTPQKRQQSGIQAKQLDQSENLDKPNEALDILRHITSVSQYGSKEQKEWKGCGPNVSEDESEVDFLMKQVFNSQLKMARAKARKKSVQKAEVSSQYDCNKRNYVKPQRTCLTLNSSYNFSIHSAYKSSQKQEGEQHRASTLKNREKYEKVFEKVPKRESGEVQFTFSPEHSKLEMKEQFEKYYKHYPLESAKQSVLKHHRQRTDEKHYNEYILEKRDCPDSIPFEEQLCPHLILAKDSQNLIRQELNGAKKAASIEIENKQAQNQKLQKEWQERHKEIQKEKKIISAVQKINSRSHKLATS